MNRTLISMSVATALLALPALPALAGAYAGEKLAGQAKISLHQARTIALGAFPGTIMDQELEREQGVQEA